VLAHAARKLEVGAPVAVLTDAMRRLSQRRALPNFGNAGAANTMMSEATRRMAERCAVAKRLGQAVSRRLEHIDFEHADDAERRKNPMAPLDELADVGEFKARLKAIGTRISVRRSEGRSTVSCCC
jgi:hypothetical protein